MKKLVLLLTFALLLSLCACGGGGNTSQTETGAQTANTDTAGHHESHDDHMDHTGTAALPAAPDTPVTSDENDGTPAAGTPGQQPDGGKENADTDGSQAQATQLPAVSQEEVVMVPEAKPEPEPQPEPAPQPAPEPEPQPEPEPEPAPQPAADPKATAEGLVGRPVSELYAAIGQPISSDYAPSCLDLEGEDGELVYDGFIVYTLRNPSGETVESVF